MSSTGDDSNMMILPVKKKNKQKGAKQEVRGKLKPKKKGISKTSRSQQRKLKKLEEEKEKEVLLSKAMETLEKHKIREDAYSLMWSSRNLGQVETAREKRRREVQFAKSGLALPHDSQPFKRRADRSASYETEANSTNSHHSEQRFDEDASIKPVMRTNEVVHEISVPMESSQEILSRNRTCNANALDDDMLVNKLENEQAKNSLQEELPNLLETSDDNGTRARKFLEGASSTSISITHALLGTLTVPTVVRVSRPKEVETNRKDLPIVMMEQEIMETINENINIIICGETGCGKTTQVPQFLFEAGFGSKGCTARSGFIGVTQPRRVAVLATAKRVAFELGVRLGKEVGFQVRHDKRIGDACAIKFMTDGILLRELQGDFLLKRYSTIILDEAHERSLNTDILIGMLSRIIQERLKIYEEQKACELSGTKINPEDKIFPLRLILMSATLRVEDFVSGGRIFRNPPPIIEVPTRQYPVTVHFSKRTEIVDYIGQAYKKILSIHKRLPPGGILVFVTGQREVEYLCQKLRTASREIVEKRVKTQVNVTDDNPSKELDMKEIDEAFEMTSSHQQTDRFSSYDADNWNPSEDESHLIDSSEEDSDLEYFEDVDSINQKNSESGTEFAGVLSADGTLASLKAAFDALAGKKGFGFDSDRTQAIITDEASNHANSGLGEKGKEADGKCAGAMRVLPLYAMLPASAQLHVFDEIEEGERLVVVATNVAETSLTIPGIKYVVDTGREKVKNYNSSNGMETYEIKWISKASAAQRSGRAGRTGPGHCYRLYSSAVFNDIFADFSPAEISKIPVDGVVLLMKSMGIEKVENFPFPTSPGTTALCKAEQCLKYLEALDSEGRLTLLGKAMSHYPLSPRHSRMLLTVIRMMKTGNTYPRRDLILGYTVAAAAALSLSNPFVLQFEGSQIDTGESKQDQKSGSIDSSKASDKDTKSKKKKLKENVKTARVKFANPTSDALSIAYALHCFESSENKLEFCNDNALHLKTMEEMSKLRKQLLHIVFNQTFDDSQPEFSLNYGSVEDVERAWMVSSEKHRLSLTEEELLSQAICAGWADRVARRRGKSELSEEDRKVHATRYQSCALEEIVFLHRMSFVSRIAPEYIVYSELLQTKRPYIHGATSVKPEWLVKYGSSLCTFSAPPGDLKPYYDRKTDQVYDWVVPTFGKHGWELPRHSVPTKDVTRRVAVFAFSLLEGIVLKCVKPAREFMAASPSIILRPEGLGHKRVGNLLTALKTRKRTIASRAMLRKLWNENPGALYSEILDWFQDRYNDRFDDLWANMHREIASSEAE